MEEGSHQGRQFLYSAHQLGMKIGFVSEAIVRGAFLSLWVRNHPEACGRLTDAVVDLLEEPYKCKELIN